ncbi:MAG: class I SAM-dependent methyltransferase [Gammaproteobacteria bacterium]|nr:class I SAM-dependent methyltransferase [Gammaproteobacteria bacterium]
MQDEAKRKQFIQKTFNTVAEDYGLRASRFFHLSGEIMAELLELGGDESVLDVASGTGATALPLAKMLPHGEVTALDFSAGMLKQAENAASETGLSNLIFQTGDMTQLPFDKHSFDHATCAFGLFFVDDMSGTLKHIANTVKPGGKVLVSGFCGESFQPMAQLCLDRLRAYGIEVPAVIGWKRMSEAEQLEGIFTQAGFDGVNIERRTIGYHIDLEGWWEVVWNAGFRGLVEQLDDKVAEFKQAHLNELAPFCDEKGLWLEIDLNFTCGVKPVHATSK